MNTLKVYGLSSFERVAYWYKVTPPVNEHGRGTDRDIRPMFDRSNKYRRIIKLNENAYALWAGDIHDRDDPHNDIWFPTRPKFVEEFAPIVWYKHADGRETFKVRNGSGTHAHIGRYTFLQRALPYGMALNIGRGKQFVTINGAHGEEADYAKQRPLHYFLPKREVAWSTDPTAHPVIKYGAMVDLEFENLGARYDDMPYRYRLISKEFEPPPPPKYTVDKDTKTEYKQGIDKFRMWFFSMYPIIQTSHVMDVYKSFYAYHRSLEYAYVSDTVRKVMKDDVIEHYMYLAKVMDLASDFNPHQDRDVLLRKFNHQINRLCEFTNKKRG